MHLLENVQFGEAPDEGVGAYSMPVESGGGESGAWAKISELQEKFSEVLAKRLALYNAIKAMPNGAKKDALINEFNEIENSIVVAYLFPGIRQIFQMIGYETPSTDLPGTLGFLPALWAAFAGASVATQAVVAASAVVLIGYCVEVLARYAAMTANPSLAPSLADQGIAGQAGAVAKVAVIGVIALAGVYLLLPMLKRSAQ